MQIRYRILITAMYLASAILAYRLLMHERISNDVENDDPLQHLPIQVAPDPKPSFRFDATKSFKLDFGRGSGWNGLDTISISEAGHVELFRDLTMRNSAWEHATLQLTPAQIAEVAKAFEQYAVARKGRSYSRREVADGEQWILWVRQGDDDQATYFSNAFPNEIKLFANDIDNILDRAGFKTLSWTSVHQAEWRLHEKDIWASLRR